MKLITIDLDGTLLNNNGQISPLTAEIIDQVRREGHIVVIATGRHYCNALPIAKELALTDALVCFNGALVMNLEINEVEIAHTYMNKDISHLSKLVKAWDCGFLTATQQRYYVESQFSHLIEEFFAREIEVKEINAIQEVNNPIYKTSVVGTEHNLDQVEKWIKPTVSHLHVIRSSERAIDIVSPKASKGAALKWLANYYNVERENTIAFGNYDNDISMLQYAGTGVAMQNAPDHVKASADIVGYSNEEHGVARFLEEFLLRKVTL